MLESNNLIGNVVYNSDDVESTDDLRRILTQNIRKVETIIEVLDKSYNVIDTIEGLSTGGSLSISPSSMTRRTGSLSMLYVKKLVPNENSLLWLGNMIRPYIGIEDLSNGQMNYFCLGTFHILEPSTTFSVGSKTIDINLSDKMTYLDNYPIVDDLKFEPETPLNEAITKLLEMAGDWNSVVEFNTLTIPYTKTWSRGTSIGSILEELRDLYMDYDAYYDVSGIFHFKKRQFQVKEDIVPMWTFSEDDDLRTGHSKSYDYSGLKNHIIVYGRTSELGVVPKAEVKINNEGSPFHENKIGSRKEIIQDDTLYSQNQVQSRADYELFSASNLREQIQLDTLPIYHLDANDVIIAPSLENDDKMEYYAIDSISIDLSALGTSSIQAHKLYFGEDTMDYQEERKKFDQYLVVLKDGIMNKGWLYLAEMAVKRYYGLEATGRPKLKVKFMFAEKYGVTANTSAYITTKDQSLSIDLADFGIATGENGDINQGKEQYADRVLGHEMVHAVMNDAMTAEKTMLLPDWFKEGSAEFIHGADERLKKFIGDDSGINQSKLAYVIEHTATLMDGGVWKGDSNDYACSYLALKWIYKNLTTTKSMKDFMKTIIDTEKEMNMVEKAIISNTVFASTSACVESFRKNGKQFVESLSIQFGSDELDTGSIAGSDAEGIIDLKAEDVFNQKDAIPNLASLKFNVVFDEYL